MLETRVLGGEASHRSVLGGSPTTRTRRISLIAVIAVGIVLSPWLGLWSLGVATLAVLAVVAATTADHRGSRLDRWRDRRRWKQRKATGTNMFIPYAQMPADMAELADSGEKLTPVQRAALGAYRDFPDGVDGFGWLCADPGVPGIAVHMPIGEQHYVSVAFSVAGQVRGQEGDEYLNSAMRAFGDLLSRYGPANRLPARLQVLTRVVPFDPDPHYAWVAARLAVDDVSELLAASYEDVVDQVTGGGLVQRHFVVVRWPVTDAFVAEAKHYGDGIDGWKALMDTEIRSVHAALATARLGKVEPLSAARVAAVLRHMQLPCWEMDLAGSADPFGPWIPSWDEWDCVWNSGPGPEGDVHYWAHRTAEIPIEAISTQERDCMWVTPLLSQLNEPVIRTLSFQIELIPSGQARRQARRDVTDDRAKIVAKAEKGELSDEDTDMMLSAAETRLRDLAPGGRQHGVGWVGHITVSAPTKEQLERGTRVIADAATEAGIDRLHWLDTYQAGAAACTWPLARGMAAIAPPLGASLLSLAAGSSTKEPAA